MKKLTIALIIVILSVSLLTVGYYLNNQAHQSVAEPIPSVSNYYLSDSRIFVVSANASYGGYPFPTVTDSHGLALAKNGETCVIINVTLRNDYSTQYPAPNPAPDNSTLVHIGLTAQIFNGENQINAKDITNAFPIASVSTNEAYTEIDYGESTTLSIYLATNNTDITSFQIIPRYIGLLTPP